ncbi:hypothetical protein QFZ33_003166 [Arthrobacter globiformis]|nr:hypothetical protein [Arthrobacter globiformis]
MSLRLVLVADTHVPKRARALPEQVWAAVEAADVVFHAGDWVSADLLDEFEQRSRRLIGVYGNNDGDELRRRLPETASVTLDGVRFSMIHETGQAKGREQRCEALFSGFRRPGFRPLAHSLGHAGARRDAPPQPRLPHRPPPATGLHVHDRRRR